MPTLKLTIFAVVLISALLTTAAAQDSASAQKSTVTITAATAGERVRITAPASVVQMHVEVYAASGEKLFDQEIRGGNVLDWHLQDGQGQRLTPGSYVCVVTAKSLNGKLTQKIGSVSVAEKSVSVQRAEAPQLSVAQAQIIGPLEENSSWMVTAEDSPPTTTVIAHDGTDGQMIRGRGALTFRIGNFFTGLDREQMRLTEEGNLGIGTSNPQAKLDVVGTIRAQRFFMAKPKSNAGDKTTTATDTSADSTDILPLIAGTGTQDRIAKWIDNAGTLGDSGITETGGFVGIGTTSPGSKLVVSTNSATLPPAAGIARFAEADGVQTAVFADAFGTNPIFNVRRANGTAASPSALQANHLIGVIGASGYGASAYMGTRARVAFWASENWTDTANGTYLTFNTTSNGTNTAGGTERVRIANGGNVGIGTASPTKKLDVAGDINVSGDYNVGGDRVFSVVGTNNVFVGSNVSTLGYDSTFVGVSAGSNTHSQICCNSFFGFAAGSENTTGRNNTMIGFYANMASGDLEYATAIGSHSVVSSSNTIALGRSDGSDTVVVPGKLQIDTMAAAGSTDLCLNSNNRVGTCSSSLRYKTSLAPYSRGLSVINRLRPISFTWKDGGLRDLGFAAEEVEKIDRLLVTYNKEGQVEGVKYDRLNVALVNALKEQQQQIEVMAARLRVLEQRLAKNPRRGRR